MSDEDATCYLNRYPDIVQEVGLGNLEAAKKHWDEKGKGEQRVSTCDGPMSDEDARCYIDRYPDLKGFNNDEKPLDTARRHYDDWGIYEGRNNRCGQRITDQQAQCYLDRYDDLQEKFGKDNWIKAKEHWYEHGHKEGRLYNCEGTPAPYKCAEQGEKCGCPAGGTIFMTKLYNFGNPSQKPIANWDQAINWAYLQTEPIHGGLQCDSAIIGDMAPGNKKQCFCEPRAI